MASNSASHQISQPMSQTWLEDPSVPSPTEPVKHNNNGSPTGPTTSITIDHTKAPATIVTSAALPIHPTLDSQEHASSLSLGYPNPSSSPPLTTQPAQSTQFSHPSSIPSPRQNLTQQSFVHQERSPVHHQAQALVDPKQTSPNNVFVPSTAHLQQEGLPANQYGNIHQHGHDDRQGHPSNRFANLLNVSNRAAQYSSLVSQPTQTVHPEQFMPATSHPAPPSTHHESTMTFRPGRDDHSVQNTRYNQSVMVPHHYQASNAPSKLFEGIEQMEKQDSQFSQSQAPPQVPQAHGPEEHIRRQLQNPTRPSQQNIQQWQGRLPMTGGLSTLPLSSLNSYSYQHQNGYQFPAGPQNQFHGNDPSQLRDSSLDASNKHSAVGGLRTVQSEGSFQANGFRPLPSAKSLQHLNSIRQTNIDNRIDSTYRTENEMDMNGRARVVTNGRTRHPVSRDQIYDSYNTEACWDLMREGVKACRSLDNFSAKEEVLAVFMDLCKGYEVKYDCIRDAVISTCISQIGNSRVPYLLDTITAPVDDETTEDAQQKLVVKRKFVEAMDKLQGDQLPTKRRGNLPKESTAYLKKWFDQHYDHPYPSDEEKLEMSKITKIGMQQISHWFINYRKRVWKPSLPPSHPVHMGENSKRPRKKLRKEDCNQ